MSQRRYVYCLGANGPRSSWYNPLKYAEKDAERLASALTTFPCNFLETKWGVATDRKSALAGLSQFVKQCQSPDLLVVHFSGHAILDEELYLLCNETDCDDLVSSAIEIGAVKKILSRSPARYNLLILDCCHAGGAHKGAFKGEQDVQDALNQAFQGSANVILSACARHERTRELDTLEGGTGFLSWILAAACTTHFHKVSRDGRSLSLADILHWIPLALEEINCSLNENQQLPLPEALIYTRGGDGDIWFTEQGEPISSKIEPDELHDKEHRLKAMLTDHSGFIRNRLDSFVGREQELEDIRQRIQMMLTTGGYITITGQAGQGKSSVIAWLVRECRSENVAHHFIPFNPGPDYQISLLRDLMARLILKHNLSDLYIASESRPALRDYFPKILSEIAAKGEREVIFIDGLDQLMEDQNGERDLSFLPDNPPEGIVFVLGTRPNDTLRPLELRKPHNKYNLPNLSRDDFDLILQHRNVHLDKALADQFYKAMQENALYLDLVAKELSQEGTAKPEEIIQHVADDPDNIFYLSTARLKRHAVEWRDVLKPLLGVLLVAREPLAVRHLRDILSLDDESLREGLARLGGLIADDGRHRYSLFHLKLYHYLRQNESKPYKEYIFATDEEESWHKRLADWCERGKISVLWEDIQRDPVEQGRREYARQHYIEHLYYAREWQKLFDVLDAGVYGQAKLNDDPSTRSYAQDLDLGRHAAAWERWTLQEGLRWLPHLWRYTLLRGSLASRADRYPPVAFRLLFLLKKERAALNLAELITDPTRKVNVFLEIVDQMLEQVGSAREYVQVLLRAHEVTYTIENNIQKVQVLCKLGEMSVRLQQWELATAVWNETEEVIHLIKGSDERAEALCMWGEALIRVQQWELASGG